MGVVENVAEVRDRVERALRRSGRSGPVTLVAVTKGRPATAVRAALAAGVTDVGENRVQEAAAKWPELAEEFARTGAVRHLVGHLQRNKVARALELFDLVQSVDSLRLADKISAAAAGAGRQVPVLLQVNGGSEITKHGFAPGEVEEAAPGVAALPGLRLAGIMVLAPLSAPEVELRAIFGGMRERFERLVHIVGPHLRHLSMGMSQDFEIAVEEGATMVRVGSALFEGA